MGLDISNLAGNTAEIEFDVLDETGHVTYRPNVITAERLERIDERQEPGEPSPFISFLVDVIEDWDVMRGSKKVPLTVEGLDSVPLPLLKLIYVAMMKDVAAGEAGKASNGRSRPKDHLAKSPTGTRSSRQRATSASHHGTS